MKRLKFILMLVVLLTLNVSCEPTEVEELKISEKVIPKSER